jgi:hypothetical protein
MRAIRLTFVAAIVSLLATLAGCGGGGGGTPPSQQSYFPLAENNTWSYQISLEAGSAMRGAGDDSVVRAVDAVGLISPVPLAVRRFPASRLSPRASAVARLSPLASRLQTDLISTVIGSEILEGRQYWAVQAELVADGTSTVQHMRIDATGLYAYREVDGQVSDICLLKLPPRVGDTWTVPGDEQIIFTTEATDDAVSVPAGDFECVRVSQVDNTSEPPYTLLTWFAYGVGLVQDNTLEGDTLTSELKLISYELH